MDTGLLERAATARVLSGGNQQRLVLARELEESGDLLVLHNPARGLDVAAARELFDLLDEFCERGGGALLISPDLHELIEHADCIYVLFDGRLSGPLPTRHESLSVLISRMAGVALPR